MADKKLKRPDFIKQKQKSSKRNQETEASCKENKKI